MKLSSVDSRPLQYGLYQGGKWFNPKTSTPALPVWETPFSAANHLVAIGPDSSFPQLQVTTVPDYAVLAADSVIVFAAGVPISTVDCPNNLYVGPYPGVVTLK